ncbi:hypothetical protein JOC94_004218 [Bacillus thermophilus]|uniref:Lipoprotein n=1 Tax=Siminovitchia thermophila TaxID=1245522 RepID=A0ABS2RE99_9BACI|nr:hypothetical protein [Siminovitchia thermophila]MBM7717193.1 hypothetical protein [Siminovitchia thermophila]
MKKHFIIFSSIFLVFISGCSPVKEQQPKLKIDETVKKEVNKDIKELVSTFNKTMREDVSDKSKESGHDKEYNQYLESMALATSLSELTGEVDDSLSKDFKNLGRLSLIIEEEYTKKIDAINSGQDVPKESINRLDTSIKYVLYILNDLDIILNNKEGNLKGYSHYANGEKVDAVDSMTELDTIK